MNILKIIFLSLLIFFCMSAQLISFGEKAVNAIFKQKKDALILFTIDSDEHASVFKTYASSLEDPAFIATILTQKANEDHFNRFSKYLGIDVTQTPKLIILKGGRQKYIMPSESSITTDSISLFFNQVANGEVTPYLKSAPVPTEDTPVKILVGSNFNSVVYGDHREYLVKFYAPWCGHCKSIAPHYESAAKALADNSNIVLAKFDGTENEVQGIEINGYPTIYFFGKDKSIPPISFNGERSHDGIISWLKDHTEHPWIEPSETETSEAAPTEEL